MSEEPTHVVPPPEVDHDASVETPPRVPRRAAVEVAPPPPKEILTFPPLPKVVNEVEISPNTGQPRRHILVVLAVLAGYFAAAATAVMYGLHWWQAVHMETYPNSANLLQWVKPDPGKWLSLTLEAVLAAVAALMAAAPAVIGFNAWNGHRWSRVGSVIALALTVGGAVLFSNWGWIAVGFTAVLTILVWLPGVKNYFHQWELFRAGPPKRPVDHGKIQYGPLPRYL